MAKGKSTLKKITGWLHLWLGLVSGLIVFVIALTGTIFVFCDEVIDAYAGDALYVKEVKSQRLSSEELIAAFKKQNPGRNPFYVVAYKDPHRSFKVASGTKQRQFKFTWMNPYTGACLKTHGAYWFFYNVAHIHSEFLAHEPGRWVSGIATLIFFVQLIGGLILWWPKKWNKATRTAAFKIKKAVGWRRRNYDLHNVIGFYSLIPALLLTITGLVMAFEPINHITQKIFGGNPNSHDDIKKLFPKYQTGAKTVLFDDIIQDQFNRNPKAQAVRLGIPKSDSITYHYCATGSKLGLLSAENGTMVIINRYTGKPVDMPADIIRHNDIESVNLNLHMGHWYGLWAKIFTFIIGIICTSLPITGFLIWLGRRKKKRIVTPVQKTELVTA